MAGLKYESAVVRWKAFDELYNASDYHELTLSVIIDVKSAVDSTGR